MRHIRFIGRTILVKNGEVEEGIRILNGILGREGVIENFRRMQRYEKPWHVRRRINYERCRAIYNEDMTRKINFLMRKNREPPYPGCY